MAYMVRPEHNKLDSLKKSSNHEIRILAETLDNLNLRVENLEQNQTEILDEIRKFKYRQE